MFAKLAVRDATLVGVAAALWWALAEASAGSGLLADLIGLIVGLGLGVAAYLFHEWGHIAGAAASGGVLRPGAGLHSVSNFQFDTDQSTRAQFLWMSLGGFIATGAFLWGYYALLPDGLLATRIARGSIAFLTLLGLTLELPLVVYALVTNKIPPLERKRVETPAAASPS